VCVTYNGSENHFSVQGLKSTAEINWIIKSRANSFWSDLGCNLPKIRVQESLDEKVSEFKIDEFHGTKLENSFLGMCGGGHPCGNGECN